MLEYPRYVRVGQEAMVKVGIGNEEGVKVYYVIEIQIDGDKVGDDWSLVLDSGGREEKTMAFTPSRTGDNQRVDFLLYRAGEETPYHSAYFWLHVKGTDERFTEFFLTHTIRTEALYRGNTLMLSTAIVNHEDRRVKYRLALWQIQYRTLTEGPTIELAPEERWEGEVPLFLKEATSLAVHYQLYVDDEPQPQQSLRLYLEIKSGQ